MDDVCKCGHDKNRHVMLTGENPEPSFHHCTLCESCDNYHEYDGTEKRHVSR